jgi:type IV pilus assembly protein PilO
MNLEDLRNIDFKNAGSLPWAVKGVLLLGILVGVVALGGWFVWKPMLDTLQQAQDEEWGADKHSGLRGTYETKLAQAVNLDKYKAQLKEAEQKSMALLKQLPNKSQMDGLLTDINQAGIGRGLEFELFKPGVEKLSQLYAEMPISIRVQGSYHDLGAFAADLAQMSRIVILSDITITGVNSKDSKGGPPGKLNMDAVAKTFRALDKSEAPPPPKKGVKKGAPQKDHP